MQLRLVLRDSLSRVNLDVTRTPSFPGLALPAADFVLALVFLGCSAGFEALGL